jgi:hypothetical protein
VFGSKVDWDDSYTEDYSDFPQFLHENPAILSRLINDHFFHVLIHQWSQPFDVAQSRHCYMFRSYDHLQAENVLLARIT